MKGFFIALLGFLFVLFAISIYSKYPVNILFDTQYVPELPNLTQPQNYSKQSNTYPYGQWEWQYSSDSVGAKVSPKKPEQFILTLTPEGRLTSTTDCNTISGSYVQNENILSIGSLVMTEKACLEETLESTYITQLSLASQYSITQRDTLILYLLNNSGMMVFNRR